MAYAPGDVLVLPFPYSGQLAERRRPALVLSQPELEGTHGLMWVAMITSDRGVHREDDVPIDDLVAAGLPSPSLVRPSKIATIEPARVLRVAGKVSQEALAAVKDVLKTYL